jgi:hypothetical protein
VTGAGLLAEMQSAIARVGTVHLERICALGCPPAALARLSGQQPTVGVARIEPCLDGLFSFSEAGEPAVIQACVDPDRELGDAGLIDLLAWLPTDPARWWWRVGTAAVLGDEMLQYGEPVPVVETPLAWLASEGRSLCILDWSAQSPCWSVLRSGPPLTFTDDTLRLRVRHSLVQSAPMPTLEFKHAA